MKIEETAIPGVLRIELEVQPHDDGWFKENFHREKLAELGTSDALYVSRGVGNSFCTLTPHTTYNFLVNEHWSPERVAVDLFDPELAIAWPLEQLKYTERDAGNPSLAALRRQRA
ncbi:dTDP-4-dehydrorhamnose 3,5-epimerase [Kribbella sp. VKM Ac-2571]|uniref:dTDP-4-dehydrorhamnose 3,5-epimerase family protein n=1 Tax=Kribbella sp. VKM Ac-2571 TaxID=2512222 RepID=UPI0010D1309B|nr:dTDP-4-dehydrorhamnose 3,5-epimerase family protein [Kribbella sp. VKM Ac-2571]TDO59709.1 dTDP-4-dehydrorhamnose 3,5-epimerase [Kribbella sp. VKM Ac-2571]